MPQGKQPGAGRVRRQAAGSKVLFFSPQDAAAAAGGRRRAGRCPPCSRTGVHAPPRSHGMAKRWDGEALRIKKDPAEQGHEFWSGKRDLNPQPSAWEADTLPLSYSRRRKETVERETGFEPATSTLARLHSTTELLPQSVVFRQKIFWRRHPDLNWRVEVLQTSALPLGYAAISQRCGAGDGI